MARTRTTKKLAQRIDLNYFKRPTPFKRAKLFLSVLAPAMAIAWIAWYALRIDHRVYSSGRMSAAHAILETECAVCHLQQAGEFSAKAADSACLTCHDGPAHHAAATKSPECATCHAEHRGRVTISATRDQNCAACHADLKSTNGASNYQSHIRSFEDGHPEFAALRSVAGTPASDRGTIKLNHAIHMKPIRRSPNGPSVQLECGNCHHTTATEPDLAYADAKFRAAAVNDNDRDEIAPLHEQTLKSLRAVTGRELMAPVKFANACAACHLLTFDKHFDEGVPHDKPEIIHAFLVKKFQDYIATHPGDVRVVRNPDRELTGKPLPPEVRVFSPAQWVAERTADAENLLWRKTCKQCHTLEPLGKNPRGWIKLPASTETDTGTLAGISTDLPYIAPANTTLQWLPHSKFDHDAHQGFTCMSCHQKALGSTESSDVLLPGIATCQTCHAPGPNHAESRCFECHTYHDWSKRKEIKPAFTLPALQNGQ
jgi:hypothetical protein